MEPIPKLPVEYTFKKERLSDRKNPISIETPILHEIMFMNDLTTHQLGIYTNYQLSDSTRSILCQYLQQSERKNEGNEERPIRKIDQKDKKIPSISINFPPSIPTQEQGPKIETIAKDNETTSPISSTEKLISPRLEAVCCY